MNRLMKTLSLLVLAMLMLGLAACSKNSGTEVPMESDEDAPLTPEEQAAANRISNGIIYFEYDSFELRADSKATLREKAEVIRQYPQLRVLIEGHCDERGTEEYNLALGERRARAAYDFLIGVGITPNQMEMVSFGKLQPARAGSGESVWSVNRRDEFKVYKPR